jgi:hypothetical protein
MLSTTQSRRILFLIKHNATKTSWGVEVELHAFLTSALHGCVFSITLRPLCLREKSLPYPLHRALDGLQSQSGEEKKSYRCRKLNPGRPARSLVTILCELSRLPLFQGIILKFASEFGRKPRNLSHSSRCSSRDSNRVPQSTSLVRIWNQLLRPLIIIH